MSRYTIDVVLVGRTLLRRREIWEARVRGRNIGGTLTVTGSSYDDALDRAKRWCDQYDANYADPPPSPIEYTPRTLPDPPPPPPRPARYSP